VPSLFRRRTQAADEPAAPEPTADEPDATEPAADEAASTEADATEESASGPRAGVKPRAVTPGKGRATPKRRDQRRRAVEPPPKDRKEAYQRLRDRERTERAEARAAMMRGEEKYLPERDRGPERALIRNLIDARRSVGNYFFAVAIGIVLLGALPVPYLVKFAVNVLWIVMLASIIIDGFLISRLVKRVINERFPKTQLRLGGLYFYAIMRAMTLRPMRMPKPQVKAGEKV
jgi:hypothetical protein